MARSMFSRSGKGELVGGAWLCQEFGIVPVQPLRFTSKIGSDTVLREVNGRHENTFQPSYAPESNLVGHVEFMFKHEGIHLELLSRLFAETGYDEISVWIQSEPTGSYSRRAAWFYEWLTARELDVPDVTSGSYVNALEEGKYWTATNPRNQPRFRVRDNMPGTPEFCPTVHKGKAFEEATKERDIVGELNQMESEFGIDLLQRAAVWLTVKESKSSFKIEGEADASREERFAVAMEMYLGNLDDLFGKDLKTLQIEVLGQNARHYGLRESPIFVGQTISFREIVHYVAPSHKDVPKMMSALVQIQERTIGSNSIIRAAALSFAFVYIHPLCDGNGRLSRFIINDILRRDQIVRPPLVIPVSATICKEMASYDRILEVLSRPFKKRYLGSLRFGSEVKYPDGEISNFEFDAYDDAMHAWKFLDLTDHTVYMASVISESIRTEMATEAEFLRKHYRIRARISEIFPASDNTLDRIIRSVSENKKITGKLLADYPNLLEPELSERVLQSVLGELEVE